MYKDKVREKLKELKNKKDIIVLGSQYPPTLKGEMPWVFFFSAFPLSPCSVICFYFLFTLHYLSAS